MKMVTLTSSFLNVQQLREMDPCYKIKLNPEKYLRDTTAQIDSELELAVDIIIKRINTDKLGFPLIGLFQTIWNNPISLCSITSMLEALPVEFRLQYIAVMLYEITHIPFKEK
jgi:hypothetical protein